MSFIDVLWWLRICLCASSVALKLQTSCTEGLTIVWRPNLVANKLSNYRCLTCNVDLSTVNLSMVCVSSWSLWSCSRIRSLYCSSRLFSDADMDSSEEPFTRSPCGLGVTALTIIPARHSISINVWNWKDTRISENTQKAWDRLQVFTKFWSENLIWRNLLEDIGIEGRRIVNWIFEK